MSDSIETVRAQEGQQNPTPETAPPDGAPPAPPDGAPDNPP